MTFADLKILMARRYYRRRTVVRAPKKKWCSIFKQGTLTNSTVSQDIAANSTESAAPTPTVVKVGNIKVQGDAITQTGSSAGAALRLVVYFSPEGSNLSPAQVLEKHPEWVMAWKFIDVSLTASSTTLGSPFSFSSRLKRNLNSGDRITIGLDGVGSLQSATVVFSCQYWTCTN